MEVGVRIVGIILRVLNFLLAPIFWLRARNRMRIPPIKDTLLLRSATDIAAAIRSGELTSEEVVSRYITRLQEVNPLLNAVVDERYRDALNDAREIDRLISEARIRGDLDKLIADKPFLGVPCTVKESCSLAGLSNAVGCLEHAGRRATSDGGGVRAVRRAGIIPLLVSNTPELCLGWETSNLLRGTTNNPYCLNRTAGGSSGGEAALLACGASALSVSSDIAGSIRIPAAFCGVYGHKPTPGIISIEGHVPTLTDENYAKFLTVGPMTRFAEDLGPLLKIMAGDNAHLLNLDKPVHLDQLKVFHMCEATSSAALLRVPRAVQSAVTRAAHHLQRRGAALAHEKFTELEDSVEMSVSVFFSMKDIPNMLQDPANPKHDKSLLLELLKLVFGGGSRSLQALGFALLHRKMLYIPQAAVPHYRRRAARLRQLMQEKLGDSGVLLYPVHNSLAHFHQQVFLRASGVMYTMLFNVLGLPATAVPVGMHGGLPVGIQVIAAPNQDRLCLAVAKELEKGFGGWQPAA
ncbi:fatty-acid amide hydrolase 2-A-like [Vanessa tameamea]|uniref:Fatty-acid amide hydrolase 2-A-like n=1 Tax=Vanessa tameamea TaxID=334116 RepID=A0A8B8IIK7_VANTA|nr:fatty-acid amide hydrolase 2-A-like [Vanessa tameamea]XP_026496182.1 fatty-acid amide hydrolase 2-A-like [Vanessa tameamea]XP_026496183.1 fatty-acid amide hydrolase 2-A-like [Vanessa tameamea]